MLTFSIVDLNQDVDVQILADQGKGKGVMTNHIVKHDIKDYLNDGVC